jgi:hypothetical protein
VRLDRLAAQSAFEIERPDLVLTAIRQVVEAVRAGRDRVGEAR